MLHFPKGVFPILMTATLCIKPLRLFPVWQDLVSLSWLPWSKGRYQITIQDVYWKWKDFHFWIIIHLHKQKGLYENAISSGDRISGNDVMRPGNWFLALQNHSWGHQCQSQLVRGFPFFLLGGGGLVAKPCLTLVTPWTVACQAPIHGILQARILQWVVTSFSRGSSQPRNQTWVSYIAGRFFTDWAMREEFFFSLSLCVCVYVYIYIYIIFFIFCIIYI